MNEQELAVDKRLRDAIIHKPDKNQEMRILVIYYIEMRARYFNAFAMFVYAILTNINILYEKEHREVEQILAIAQQPTQWGRRIPSELLDTLIKQADRDITSSNHVKKYWYTVPPDTTNRKAVIAQSEKRTGLFPDDGLFKMFINLTNKDIRAKIIADNRRITSFLQIIQKIMTTINGIHIIKDSEANHIDSDINKYIVSLSERFETKGTYSRRVNRHLFSLLRSTKIAPTANSPSSVSDELVSDKLAIDKKAPLITQMFAYSRDDLKQFLTITDSVLKRLDTLSLHLVNTKNYGIDKLEIIKYILSICERRSEYIHKMRKIHYINGFNPIITTYSSTYTSVFSEYKGGRKKKPKSITKDTKKKKVMPKPKPTRRIRLRFP